MSPLLTAPSRLLELTPELLELVLSFLNPCDLTRFGQTCRSANAFIHPGNQVLWKSAFLHVFDNPKGAWELLQPTARAANRTRESEWDWFHEVHRRCTALNAVCDGDAVALSNPEDIITTFLDILESASYSNVIGSKARISLNVDFLENLFRIAPRPERIVHDYHRDIDSQSLPLEFMTDSNRPLTRSMLGRRSLVPDWASRFHIFYGSTKREDDSTRAKSSARALVYDWSITGADADYGPFKNDKSGAVNWQVLEAITSLMLRIFDTTCPAGLQTPHGFRHSIPFSLPSDPFVKDDWAGVTGTFVGTYAFLDYRALVHYNFANHLEYPMDLGQYEEACGDIMRLKLKLSNAEDLRNDNRLQTKMPYCADLPTIYFTGSSNGRPIGRPSILVRGSASLVPGGRQVRWRFIISYAGQDQWQLEGVQPGGIRSGGIYGLWSHVEHEEHGPVGPFCYFPYDVCAPAQK
ncbi:uncharacterized protein BDR25DRAFT_280867 [Lindgomyces ingoldianus]|uniref:Uncharacterized protein n=1 Tax=Lindgomyces ingoldianus TaxID=673940 RepID=A0ACB6R4X2_9PLEO|nr:uncharacterized protein BDR25DRAFT_280867 [Lindgomyces ingoldianus]KAF2474122.1 hypothetical protein BDR25DRAFT_280867 [Lindgomyces ingoldianus]